MAEIISQRFAQWEALEFHRDDLPEDMVKALFPVDDLSALTLTEMVDYLQLNRFGSFLDNETKGQMFIMDLTFEIGRASCRDRV